MLKTWMFAAIAAVSLTACHETNSNFCAGQNADNNCSEDGGTKQIDAALGCVADKTCMDVNKPVCDLGNNTCVQCAGSDDALCIGKTPVCGSEDMCRACGSDAECTSQTCLPDGSCATEASVLYASTTGDPISDCSIATPCTLTRAVLKLSAGQTIIKLAPGTYALSAPVAITSTATLIGDGAILDAHLAGGGSGALAFSTVGPFEVDYLEIEKASSDGISANGGTLTLNGVRVHDGAKLGINTNQTTVTLERSVIAANTGGGVSIGMADFTVINNIITLNGGPVSTIGGAQLAPMSSNALFLFNTVADNVIMNADKNSGGVNCVSAMAIDSTIASNNQLGPNCMPTHSLFDGTATLVVGTGNKSGMAAFKNTSPTMTTSPDYYRIGSTSDAIGAGNPTPSPAVPIDIDGNPRPTPGGGFDIGASQFKP